MLFSRTAVCSITGISERQLAVWEREDLVRPSRLVEIEGHNEPLYDREILSRIRIIRTLSDELEVNLAGIDVILNLLERIER